MNEKQLTKAVIDEAHRHHWIVAHFKTAQVAAGRFVTPVQGDAKGFPDLVLLRGPRGLAIELKVGKNKATPEQIKWLRAFEQVGFDAWVLTERDWPDEVARVLK